MSTFLNTSRAVPLTKENFKSIDELFRYIY